jgi:ribonucleoside-triphosphate reductase
MNGREVKQARLSELRAQLLTVEGTPTEVYSRIVGYYRSVRNWNAGKREEFGRRQVYAFPGVAPVVADGAHSAATFGGQQRAATTLGGQQRAATTSAGQQGPAAAACFTFPADSVGPAASYLLFTRQQCPNCPPLAEAVRQVGLDGQTVDTDTADGLAIAHGHDVLATPTVILFDQSGRELGRAYTRPQLLALTAPVRVATGA